MLTLVKEECRKFIIEAQTLLEEGRRIKKAKRYNNIEHLHKSNSSQSNPLNNSNNNSNSNNATDHIILHPEQVSPSQSLVGTLPKPSVTYYKTPNNYNNSIRNDIISDIDERDGMIHIISDRSVNTSFTRRSR